MTAMTPLRVRAHLAAGIAQAAPWGIALDGLLAAEIWAATKFQSRATGQEPLRALDQEDVPDLDLPLARCQPAAGPWHWAATCAYPEQDQPRVDVHTWTGRVDHRALEAVAVELPKTISDRQGRYRARRMPLLVTVCRSVTWHAIGDVDAIAELLAGVASIGKKRSSGEGHVLRWEVEPAPELDPWCAAHLHPDGSLGRPTPSGCLHGQSSAPTDGGQGMAGVRPPYMHRSRQHRLHLPALLGS